MASAEELMAVVGTPVDSMAVRALVASDDLDASSEPDMEEGEPIRSYLSGRAAGYQLLCEGGRVETAFLFVVPSRLDEGYSPFTGSLPGGLRASDKRPVVLGRFGAPERSGEAFTDRVLGRRGPGIASWSGPSACTSNMSSRTSG